MKFSHLSTPLLAVAVIANLFVSLQGIAQEEATAAPEIAKQSFDEKIDSVLDPLAAGAEDIVFFPNDIFAGKPGWEKIPPLIIFILGGTALFLTLRFAFVNFRAFGLALKTVRGKITDKDAPGQITHFQALSAAVSATVGLGNIAGVAVAIGLGGPGATFWMILMGLFSMTTKFAECTLGVKYRKIDDEGKVHGGAMYYLSRGFAERGMGKFGKVLAIIFAVMCIGGTFGAGNMFQANQAHAQFSETFGVLQTGWQFGLIVAVFVGLVIIGGIVWIARVTSFIVPFMCGLYILTALYIIFSNAGEIPAAISTIISSAFSPEAVGGGFVGVLIQGLKRATFSNEAGFGSAPIAHSAVKTNHPASEGVVAMLEPFVDTVVVCTMTALVIVITGLWTVNADTNSAGTLLRSEASATAAEVGTLPEGTMLHIDEKGTEESGNAGWNKVSVFKDGETAGWVAADKLTMREGWGGGVWVTSKAFESAISWFPYVLAVAVFLFAFSTMISWSYYGEQAVIYLFGQNKVVILVYKFVFCGMIVVGAAASLNNVLRLSDAMVFAMVLPNLIGVYVLLPVVQREYVRFKEYADSKK